MTHFILPDWIIALAYIAACVALGGTVGLIIAEIRVRRGRMVRRRSARKIVIVSVPRESVRSGKPH